MITRAFSESPWIDLEIGNAQPRIAAGGAHGNEQDLPTRARRVRIGDMSRLCRRTMVFLSGVALTAVVGARAGGWHAQACLNRDFQSALSHYNSGDYPRAAQELEALARQAPESFDVHELLGLVYSAQGKEAEASPHLEKAVHLKPNSAPARCNLAVNLSKLGKGGQAEREFKKAIALEPRKALFHYSLAMLWLRLGRPEDALPILHVALALDPKSRPDSARSFFLELEGALA